MDDAATMPTRHKLDVACYDRMIDAGIFGQEDRIELIEADIIDVAPIGQGHEAIVGSLTEKLVLACMGRATAWPQNSVRLGQWSAPQPALVERMRRTSSRQASDGESVGMRTNLSSVPSGDYSRCCSIKLAVAIPASAPD